MSNTTPSAMVPAGWYPDPANALQDRYWDGSTWTEEVRLAGAPAMMPAPPPAQAAPASTGNGYSIAGIFFGVLAFFIAPIIFGPLGMVLGAVGKSKGESKATTAIVVSGLGFVLGLTLSFIIAFATL